MHTVRNCLIIKCFLVVLWIPFHSPFNPLPLSSPCFPCAPPLLAPALPSHHFFVLCCIFCPFCTAPLAPPFPVEVPPLLHSLISLLWPTEQILHRLCYVMLGTVHFGGLYISSAYFLHRPGLMCDSPLLPFYVLVEKCSHQFVPFTIGYVQLILFNQTNSIFFSIIHVSTCL